MKPKYEIKLYRLIWIEVSYEHFRACAGPRRLNGKRYSGPVCHQDGTVMSRRELVDFRKQQRIKGWM